MNKPFSEACERNKESILQELAPRFSSVSRVLEIGSGSGQHAVFFAKHLPHLAWQPSDQSHYLDGIRIWVSEAQLSNLNPPLELEVKSPWPAFAADAIFSANTLHIMTNEDVQAFFIGAAQRLPMSAPFCIYGPFNQNNQYTSTGNQRLDQWIHKTFPGGGIKDINWVLNLAQTAGFHHIKTQQLPANNLFIHFIRQNPQ